MAREEKKIGQAQYLRKQMTSAERRLWTRLRNGRMLGVKFLRQQPIGPYIGDFYSSVARLCIDLDGDGHIWQTKRDRARDAFFQEQGIRVLRFRNSAVLFSLEIVLETIKSAVAAHVLE